MSSSSQKLGRSQRLILVVAAAVELWVGGWGSISAQTDTEREAEKALRDLKIDPRPEPNIPMPEIYKTPPEIVEHTVGGVKEFRLFYFCKYHTSDDLRQIVHDQFATKIFDPKGKATTLPSYTVSSNSATNQLIVRCPSREDIDAVVETLAYVDVQPIQVKIDCLISEIYADKTFDRETTIAIENLLGEEIAMKPAGTAFGASVRQLVLDDAHLPAFPGASLREVARSRMGLNIGYLSTTRAFTVLVDLLESRGYLKILMNPTLEVVNGKVAKVLSSQHVPLEKTTMRSTRSDYLETRTEYIDVIDSLEITPHVFADGYIGLETTVVLGSKNTPEGVKQIPIVTKKEITNEENRIRRGESLIIGGMRKNEEFGVARGVPILKDIPLIGFLFSSEDTEQRAVETIFILTPTISTGGVPREEVVEEVKRKHEPSIYESITDILGFKDREREQQLQAQEAEQSRQETRIENTEARNAVREADGRAERAEAELNRVKTAAEKIKADAQKAGAEAAAKAKAAEEAIAAADKAATDAAKAKAEADKAKAEADARTEAAGQGEADAGKETTDGEKDPAEAGNDKAGPNRRIRRNNTAKAEVDARATAAEQTQEKEEKTENPKPEEGAEKAKAEKDQAGAKEA